MMTRRILFRFSMSAVATSLTVWLGWNLGLVQQRANLQQAIKNRDGHFFALEQYCPPPGAAKDPLHKRQGVSVTINAALNGCLRRAEPKSAVPIPRLRRWLGDQQAYVLIVSDEADFRRASSSFPEATILLVQESFSKMVAAKWWAVCTRPVANNSL